MLVIAGLAVVFLVLLSLPFAVSLLSVQKSREVSLIVKSDNVRDPRYFSNSFRALVDKGIDRENRTIKMSKLEPFLYADEIAGSTCNTIVIAESRFRPLGVTYFSKEIFAESTADIPANTRMRAIACLDKMEIGENCAVIRWADAEKQLTVLGGCTLGMNASSGERIHIAPGCTFRRLYAPEIVIGLQAVKTVRIPLDPTLYTERLTNPDGIAPNETIRKTIVTEHSLEIGEGAVVMGSVKSTHHIYIRANARINGNVIADGVIIIDEGAQILGTAFSQDSILVGPGAEIGVKPKIKSLIARQTIVLCETAKVYGYVGCEVESFTISKESFYAELRKKRWASKIALIKAELADVKFYNAETLAEEQTAEGTKPNESEEENLFE
jgi:cytoskeletal protein CcmA (bactofilin family)